MKELLQVVRTVNAAMLATAVAGVFNGANADQPISEPMYVATILFALTIPVLGATQVLLEFAIGGAEIDKNYMFCPALVGWMMVYSGLYFTVLPVSPIAALIMMIAFIAALLWTRSFACALRKADALPINSVDNPPGAAG
ncbi:MAG: hypothetical protein Q8K78_11075 [Planctomycetaceae bacterium]|nr:hypothetical protein [Planctomycetaceae bacterium]